MEIFFYRLFIIASVLTISSIALAETAPMPKPVEAPAKILNEQTRWLAKEGVITSFKGKKVLTGMTILPDTLELVLNKRFSWDVDAFTQPSRLEIHIFNAVNGLEANSILINQIGIAKVLFENTDNFLKVVLFPAEGTPLPSQVDLTDDATGLLIHTADLMMPRQSAPVRGKPAIPVESGPPTESVTPSTPPAKLTPPPSSVHTEILPGSVAPVVTPIEESNHYYSLIAGESVNRKKLDPVVVKLTAAGFKPALAETTREVEVFRLKVACFADRKPAEMRRAQVARRTRKAFFARDVDSYCVFAGSLMSEDSARKEQKRLEAKGLKGLQIVRTRVPLKVWQVISGRNADGLESALLIRKLSKHGIAVWIVETGN
jgi:hypothetical protein